VGKPDHILVTGGAGYIGSHTCKALAKEGFLPLTYDNLCAGHRWAVKWGPFEHGDILDRSGLTKVLIQYRPVAVIHFAAFASVAESVFSPSKYYANNVCGTLNLLESMRDARIDKIIFSSSCSVYGMPIITPIPEDHRAEPINPYGASKLMIERILADYDRAYGLRSISLRYFNAAGADPEGEIGEDHNPETHLIPLVLSVAAGLTPDVKMYGTDYSTPDGTCVRDYIHVCDLAHAHVLSLKALLAGADSKVYNLGNGHGFSVRQVVECAQQVTGRTIRTETCDRRQGDADSLVGNASRIRSDLGWIPGYVDVETIIETAWRWMQTHDRPCRPVGMSSVA
jgi:UDP-arabinose 4-epimerase